MLAAIPVYFSTRISRIEITAKVICISFPFQPNDFGLNENIGTSETISQEKESTRK